MNGLIVGYYPGVWDLLHVGHINALAQAKADCDYLYVGVPNDDVVVQDKGHRPAIPCADRVVMLRSVKFVDGVLVYHRLDFVNELKAIRPNRLYIGEDWGTAQRHTIAELWCAQSNAILRRIERYNEESTTAIRERIRDEH